jgi:hypothetical protein
VGAIAKVSNDRESFARLKSQGRCYRYARFETCDKPVSKRKSGSGLGRATLPPGFSSTVYCSKIKRNPQLLENLFVLAEVFISERVEPATVFELLEKRIHLLA